MKNSHIEWTDHTFNPWEGCTKISPGCAHCYAEARNKRFSAGANWGPGAPRRRTSAQNWKQPIAWNKHWNEEGKSPIDLAGYRKPRVFCASIADWLDHEVDPRWRLDLLELVRTTPNLDWLLLTKRPQDWLGQMHTVLDMLMDHHRYPSDDLYRWLQAWTHGTPPENIWVGTTVEDQTRADSRIPQLLSIPAKIRFLSCEPMLGPVNLDVDPGSEFLREKGEMALWFHGIHWVICGGESGHAAREMNPDWARSLRDQCAAAGVAFFFKQWGKQAPGRELDGREHSAFPSVP